MRSVKMLLTATGAVLTAVFVVSALATTASPASASRTATKPHVQTQALTISGAKSQEHVSPSSGNLAIAPRVPVRVTVTNYTREYHTITVPGLHVSALIFPARGKTPRKTTFTFTAHGYGSFAWYCAFCPSGGHGRPHKMGGTIYAVINPSVLP